MGGVLSYVWKPSIPANYDVPDEALGLSMRDKQHIKESWEMLLKKGIRPMGISLFEVFFELFPQHQQYFAFKDTPIDKLKDDKKLRSHASNVMHSLTGIVGLLDDPEALTENLQKLGSNHSPRNISKQALLDLKVAVFHWFKKELGSSFTEKHEKSWDKTIDVAFSVFLSTMLKDQ